MFRRKEDELNDAENLGQGSLLASNESVKVITPDASSSYSPSAPVNNAHSPITGNYAAGSAAAAAAAAPRAVEPVQARPAAPAASTFRAPPAPQNEVPRARAQEPKPISSPTFPAPVSDRGPLKDTRRVLTVGADILLKGEIATCDRLVIEGKLDAVLNDVGTVELAESGSFKGVAQVENAEISGLFEGELVCKGRLVIYASGRVCGKITYGEVEIERGGELTGEIKSIASAAAAGAPRKTKEDRFKTEAA